MFSFWGPVLLWFMLLDLCLSVMLVYCGQAVGWIKMPLGREVGLGPADICVRWGPSSPPKKGTAPQFSAHVYCGQTAGWIKMPLGTEVGLGPDDIALDGDSAPPMERGTAALHFSAHVYRGQMVAHLEIAELLYFIFKNFFSGLVSGLVSCFCKILCLVLLGRIAALPRCSLLLQM